MCLFEMIVLCCCEFVCLHFIINEHKRCLIVIDFGWFAVCFDLHLLFAWYVCCCVLFVFNFVWIRFFELIITGVVFSLFDYLFAN
jgi:hypothetical protein